MKNLSNIHAQLESADLFSAFKTQLIKDFEQSNFPIDKIATIPADYYSIHYRIATLLEYNEFSTQQNILQLLYRIDISEAQLSKYLNEEKEKNYFDLIAELIIKRVLQKVVLKQLSKNNGN